MYATCLFCNNALGRNEALERFPIGRRIAFDSATGRLWAVCRRCSRWNLSPLETRWEAIEDAERAFSGTRLRVSTDNIGMARVRDGTELVRIGAPQKPEFAAWRYGQQFGKRYRKSVALYTGFGMMQILPMLGRMLASRDLLSMNSALLLSLAGTGGMVAMAGRQMYRRRLERRRPSIAIRDEEGALLQMTVASAGTARIFPVGTGTEWQLMVSHDTPSTHGARKRNTPTEQLPRILGGPTAERALAHILPHINGDGSGQRTVNDALELASTSSSIGHMLRGRDIPTSEHKTLFRLDHNHRRIAYFPTALRLAMEMAVHEEDERRAMEGELKELEQRWRDADTVAQIADAMFQPEQVEAQLESMKEQAGTSRRDAR